MLALPLPVSSSWLPADTEPLCPQGWLSPALLLTLHAMNQLRVPGGDRVSPLALLK